MKPEMLRDRGAERPILPRPGGRTARVREAVMQATLEILAEKGFEGTGLAEIGKRAGVHTATVYRRWGSKRRLVGEAMLTRTEPLFLPPDLGSFRADLA